MAVSLARAAGGGGPRRRFGVSLPAELAEKLDRLAELLGSTRSMLVEKAVEALVSEHLHYLEPHRCTGLLVLRGPRDAGLSGVVERFRDVVVGSLHYHLGGGCVELLLVEGPSERVVELQRELVGLGCGARFIPLHPAAGGEGAAGGD